MEFYVSKDMHVYVFLFFLQEQTCITHVARLHSELQSLTMPSGPEPSQTAIRPLVLP